jgi:hypothetical protein
MALQRDQIVGFDKYPVSHRGMAYGGRPAPSSSGRKSKRHAQLSQKHPGIDVVNCSLQAPWPPTARSSPPAAHRSRRMGTIARAPGHLAADSWRCTLRSRPAVYHRHQRDRKRYPHSARHLNPPAHCKTVKLNMSMLQSSIAASASLRSV